jgi:AraC-like DNA-binding protein
MPVEVVLHKIPDDYAIQAYNQNFYAFINNYRLEELERTYLENYTLSNEVLAEKCGFGSINSMKRAISVYSNISMAQWKKRILEK